MSKEKVPFYKKKWFMAIIVVFLIGGIISAIQGDEKEEPEIADKENVKEVENEETKEVVKEEVVEEDHSEWDELKGEIVGVSDKDFKEVYDVGAAPVRNDTTGNWKYIVISEPINIEEYALSYSKENMEDKEIHFIINFSYNTTTVINKMGGLIYVDIREYTEKEEHDADKIGGGMTLKQYMIYPDGDIEEIKPE